MAKIKKLSKISPTMLVATLLVATGGLGVFVYRHSHRSEPTAITSSAQQGINFDPATKEDTQRSEDTKKKNQAREELTKNQPQAQQGEKKSVTPIITYAGQYAQSVEVGAGVDGIFEDGGTCTATFTMGGTSFSKTVIGVKDVKSVSCPVMSATSNEFSQKGTWSIAVSYASPAASGSSEARQIEVK